MRRGRAPGASPGVSSNPNVFFESPSSPSKPAPPADAVDPSQLDPRWFVGKLPRAMVESMLMSQGKKGDFVVRESETSAGSVTLVANMGQGVVSKRVLVSQGRYAFQGTRAGHSSLERLLASDSYCKNPGASIFRIPSTAATPPAQRRTTPQGRPPVARASSGDGAAPPRGSGRRQQQQPAQQPRHSNGGGQSPAPQQRQSSGRSTTSSNSSQRSGGQQQPRHNGRGGPPPSETPPPRPSQSKPQQQPAQQPPQQRSPPGRPASSSVEPETDEFDGFGGFGEAEEDTRRQVRQPTYHQASGDMGNPEAQRAAQRAASGQSGQRRGGAQESFRGFGAASSAPPPRPPARRDAVPPPPPPKPAASDDFAGFSEDDEEDDVVGELPVSQPPSIPKRGVRRNAPSFKNGRVSFQCNVTVRQSEFATKLKLQGVCEFTVTSANKVYMVHSASGECSTWPVQLLRRYGRPQGSTSHSLVYLEAGTRCASGQGILEFDTSGKMQTNGLLRAMINATRAVKQEALLKMAERNKAIAEAQKRVQEQEAAEQKAREEAAARHAAQAKIEAQKRIEERKRAEKAAAAEAKRKAEEEAAEAKRKAAAQQKTSEDIYASREDLLKQRAEKTKELEERAEKLEISDKMQAALATKTHDKYASMFNDSHDDRANKSKIWLALNPQPLAFQTAQDRREKEENIIEVGMPGGRNFNAMRDILTNVVEEVPEEEPEEEFLDLDGANEFSNPTADGDGAEADELPDEDEEDPDVEEEEEEEEEKELTEEEWQAELDADRALFAMLDKNRAQREAEDAARREKLKQEYAEAARKKQEELDRELAIIAEEKRLEKLEREKEKEKAVAEAQARASELSFDFTFG
eukprot:m.89867 g.89867  ORF g.89867 m.89867 type:complete len:862 (+) comp11787_c0_seq1:91-2676(+)